MAWWNDPFVPAMKPYLRRMQEQQPVPAAEQPSQVPTPQAPRQRGNRMPYISDAQKIKMVRLSAQGLSNMEIAAKLRIPRTTVSYHLRMMRQHGEVEDMAGNEEERQPVVY